MDSYKKYRNTRDSAWQFLIDHNITKFPLDVVSIFHKYGVAIVSKEIEVYAKTIKFRNNLITLYEPNTTTEQLRFTLAHELGHVLLGHCDKAGIDEYDDTAANVFASRILMPITVIDIEKLDTVEKIQKFFGVSEEAAKIRLDRYLLVKPRNKINASPLEREYSNLYLQSKK